MGTGIFDYYLWGDISVNVGICMAYFIWLRGIVKNGLRKSLNDHLKIRSGKDEK